MSRHPESKTVALRLIQDVLNDTSILLEARVEPFESYKHQKPRVPRFTERFTVDEVWKEWAKDLREKGHDLVVEEKFNGFYAGLHKKGDRVKITFEKTDVTKKLPEIAKILKGIDADFLLDVDVGIERDGKRLPRVELMTLLAEKPKLKEKDKIVITLFDLLYWDEHFGDAPFKERREALEDFYKKYGLDKEDSVRLSSQMPGNTKAQIQKALDKFGKREGSEGIVTKDMEAVYQEGGSSGLDKLKLAAEVKALVTDVRKNKNGTYSFRAALFPGKSRFENTIEYKGKKVIDLGRAFNSPFKAQEGDVVTFSVEEIIIGEEKGKPALQWLGARPIDIDKERKEPYFANQVVDIAKRGNILQSETEESVVSISSLPAALGSNMHRRVIPADPEAQRYQRLINRIVSKLVEIKEFPISKRKVKTKEQRVRARDDLRLVSAYFATLKAGRDIEFAGKKVTLEQIIDSAYNLVRSLDVADAIELNPDNWKASTKPLLNAIISRYRKAGLKPPVKEGETIEEALPPDEFGFETPEGETRSEKAESFWEENWWKVLGRYSPGSSDYILHGHLRGLPKDGIDLPEDDIFKTEHSLHLDLRLELPNFWWGFAVVGDKDKLEDFAKGSVGDKNYQVIPKFVLPGEGIKKWLTFAKDKPVVTEPGSVGATSEKSAKFFGLETGTYKLGVANRGFVEIFLDGKNLNGRFTLQEAKFGDREAWLLKKPDDQKPYAETHELETELERLAKDDPPHKILIWTKPGEKPKIYDVEEGKEIPAGKLKEDDN